VTQYDRLLETVQGLLAAGKHRESALALRRLNSAKVPRRYAQRFGEIARRVNLPNLTLRLLGRYVSPVLNLRRDATSEEVATYAAALTRAGAPEEALTLLQSVTDRKHADTLLFTSHSLFALWRYEESISVLREYLKLESLTPKQRVIGELNLSAALVHEEHWDAAKAVLKQVEDHTREKNLNDLVGHVWELWAQWAIGQRQWSETADYLQRARNPQAGGSALDHLFLDKWAALLSLLRDGATPEARGLIAKVKSKARDLKHWETVRDSDYYLACAALDESLAIHLWFGTPLVPFRKRLVDNFRAPIALPGRYHWQLGEAPSLNKEVNFFDEKTSPVEPGSVAHRLALILVSDFYRPFRVASLFAKLFPGEYYNSTSSPPRIYQAVLTLRKIFAAEKLPLVLRESASGYVLSATEPCRLVIEKGIAPAGKRDLSLEKLKSHFLDVEFTGPEAAARLDVPKRTLLRVLDRGLELKILRRTGQGKATVYQFVDDYEKKAA